MAGDWEDPESVLLSPGVGEGDRERFLKKLDTEERRSLSCGFRLERLLESSGASSSIGCIRLHSMITEADSASNVSPIL